MSSVNGGWQKIALLLLGVLISVTLAWTTAISGDGKKRDTRIATSEENIRTIHYEAQVQRKLLKRIADAVGAEVDDVPDVRPLREVK